MSPDLLVDVEGTRRYLRSCGFTVAQSEEIIADARSDQPSTSTTQDMVITSFRQHALQGFLRRWPKQRACDRGDTAEEAVRARTTDAREASAGVVTPARTSARSDREHVVTPSIIPTPKALFTRLKGEHEEVEEETAAEAAATLASTSPWAKTTASFKAMDELWEQARLELEERLFATPPDKCSADSGAFYATSNQICATPLRCDAGPAPVSPARPLKSLPTGALPYSGTGEAAAG